MALRKNPLKPMMDKIPTPMRNRYFLLLVFFCAWMIFFDKHDIVTQYSLQQTLNRLDEDQRYYEEKIKEAKRDMKDIEKNKEKFAREHYYLKKSNEDVFIFVESEK